MKNFNLVPWVTVLFLACLLVGCDDEYIEGQFIESLPCERLAETGSMRASIDTTDFHVNLTDQMSRLVIHQNGFIHLFIEANHEELGQLFININSPEIGSFDLTTTNATGFVSTFNHHEALTNFGFFAPNLLNEANPYVTFIDNNGFGEFEITRMDYDELVFSGNFSFSATRLKRNPDTGEIITDENGGSIVESIEISCGYLNDVPFETEGGGNQPLEFDEFYAEVDGEEFIENIILVNRTFTNGLLVHNINAITNNGRLLRMDIPDNLEVGTHPFEAISDGSKLTVLYNDNNGSEALTANPGTITISEFDHVFGVLEASFSFTGTDPLGLDSTIVEVTNGELKVSLAVSTASSSYLTATVDGLDYDAALVSTSESIVSGVNVLNISTRSESNESLNLILPTEIAVGQYEMSANVITGNEKVGLYSPQNGIVTSSRSNTGTLNIISNDLLTGEIEGTFEFEAIDVFGQNPEEYSVTSGSFFVIIF